MAQTIAKPTPQQAYDKIRKHFTKPGVILSTVRSATAAGIEMPTDGDSLPSCLYRTPVPGQRRQESEVKCAIGALIPDSRYRVKMDGTGTVTSLIGDFGHIFKGWGKDQDLMRFLGRAQSFHDNAPDVEAFVQNLDALAKREGLKVPA